jgi:2OG-Fe(II) oxygenase superfamily
MKFPKITKSSVIVPGFSDMAADLRRHFDARFADPRRADSNRFVWDYWHVQDQYTLLRTPAYHFFPQGTYDSLHQQLAQWGRENLGCHDISPPWLSCYVEGCRQELHADLPHGPWAFVFSLTPWKNRKFSGGETLLLKPETLDFWESFQSSRGLEQNDIIERINPQFNQLTVFDPRIPHGVREVRGVHDPRDGRLVIHGWFVQPRPFIRGPLSAKSVQLKLKRMDANLAQLLTEIIPVHGTLSLRFSISRSGRVGGFQWLTSALRSQDPASIKKITTCVFESIRDTEFQHARSETLVTLPLVFQVD